MAPHSSTHAWKIPWTEEPGRLQFMGALRVGHDWVSSHSLFTFMHWGRKWQPTPVFLPGESQGRGSLVGCYLWGCTESDTTERLQFTHFILYHWRRKWQPTPVFLPGESRGQRSLVPNSVMLFYLWLFLMSFFLICQSLLKLILLAKFS